MNNIAVVLRGHCRTFKYIYHKIFEFYDSIAANVDYYFAGWRSSIEHTNISEIFEKSNKKLVILKYYNDKEHSEIKNGFLAPAHMCYNLLPYKRVKEKSAHYDVVFETRPDVLPYVKLGEENTPFMMECNTLYVPHLEIHRNGQTNKREVAIPDWFLISDSRTFDLMSQRFLCDTHIGAQIQYIHYAKSEGIDLGICNRYDSIIIRPNRIAVDWNNPWNVIAEQVWKGNQIWLSSSDEEKREILRDTRILETDYLTGPAGCLR